MSHVNLSSFMKINCNLVSLFNVYSFRGHLAVLLIKIDLLNNNAYLFV